MAGKKKKIDPTEPKSKSLFDHLDAIFVKKDPKYFDTLSDGDKKTWSNYMINRFISMNPNYIEVVNTLQKYSKIPPEALYRFYSDLLPRGKQYNKYVKSEKVEKYGEKDVNYVSQYLECSRKEAIEYMDILSPEQIFNICKKYGLTTKELDKVITT